MPVEISYTTPVLIVLYTFGMRYAPIVGEGKGCPIHSPQLLNDKTMDHGIVALVRLATYQYAIENEDMEVTIYSRELVYGVNQYLQVGGMPLSEAALASSDAKTFNEWLDRNVRTDEQEVGSSLRFFLSLISGSCRLAPWL